MRIIKKVRVNADEDDVQIVYESPADEDCQFIEEKVVNPPNGPLMVSSKASCSRTSVIAGRKRPASDPLPSPRKTAFKQQALQANYAESLPQPTTSQQSDESSIQDSSPRQQPSISGQTTTVEQLPLGPYSCNFSSSLGGIYFPRKMEVQGIPEMIYIWQQQPTVRIFQENNNVTSVDISLAGTITHQEELEATDSQTSQEQTVSTATQSCNPPVEETNVASDNNIPTPAFINQQTAFKQHNLQLRATIAHSNIGAIPSTSTAIENIPSVALENQRQQALEKYSKEAEERSNMIPPRNIQAFLARDNNIYFRGLGSPIQETIEQHDSQEQQEMSLTTRPSSLEVEHSNASEDLSSDEELVKKSHKYIADYCIYRRQSRLARKKKQRALNSTTQPTSLEGELSNASEDMSTDEEEFNEQQQRYLAGCLYRQRLRLNAYKKEEQAMSSTTQPNIHPIRENTNVINDPDIPSPALQQETFEQHDSQETQQQAVSSTTQPNIVQENINVASANGNSPEELINRQLVDSPIMNQQQQTLEQSSQETEQQTVNMTTQPNIHEVQESINVANDHNVQNQALMNQQRPIEQQTEPQAMSSTTHSNVNVIQEGIMIKNIRQVRPLQLPNLQRQTPGPIPIVQVKNETSGNSAGVQNQTSRATRPLDLTQAGDLVVPTVEQGIAINMFKARQHLVWKGTIECQKKVKGSPVSVSVPLRCSIYGIKTSNGNMNVNADLWPSHMTLLLLPRHILLRQDLFKELNLISRRTTINFDVESEFVNVLRKSMSFGWMGFIQFPRHKDMMIVLYMPHKQLCIGYITNNESGFISKFTQVCRAFDMEERQKYQPAINTFETIDKDIDAYISLLRLQQQFLSLSPHQAQARPQQASLPLSAHQASLPPSQQTSLPLPAHQQSSLSQNPHQYITTLASHPQASLPLASYSQTSLPLASHPQTSLPLASHPQTSLPLASHPQTSLPLASHAQSSLPLASHPQTNLPLASHQQTSLSIASQQQANLLLASQQHTSLPMAAHQQASLPQCSCQNICLPQCSHQQTILPQCAHQQTSLPQPSHVQTSLPQSSHIQTILPHSSHQQTGFPQSSQQLINLFHIADSLQEQVNANKYETVDRHIDACISALRQRNQTSQGAGPSTSKQALTPIQHRRLCMEQILREMKQETSNESLMHTSGASNSQTMNSSQELSPVNPKQVESQASEIFHPSLVKKIARKKLKATGKSFKSVHDLCEAILAYEESKRKNKEAKKSKVGDTNEALLCKICMDEQMNIVFEPCGHLSTCLECSQPLEKCPMCRTHISNKRKIYMS